MWTIGRQSVMVAGARSNSGGVRSFSSAAEQSRRHTHSPLRVVHHIQTIKQLKELRIFAKRQRPVNFQFSGAASVNGDDRFLPSGRGERG